MSQQQQVNKDTEVKVLFREATIPDSLEEVTRTGRVKWGKDNLYPQFLWYMVENSPIHKGIVSSKVDYIISGGLTYDGDETEFKEILSNGLSKYDLNEVSEFVCLDNEVSNCYYLHCKKDRLTGKWYIDPIGFELIRPNEDCTRFEYSDDWSTDRQDPIKTGYRVIPSFFSRSTEDTECLLQVKTKSRQTKSPYNKKITGGFFSSPGYSGGIPSILTDIEINFFNYAEVVNGFKGGTMIYMPNGAPQSEEVRKNILRDLKAEGTDRSKQAGMSVVFGEGEENMPKIQQINGNDLDKRYEGTDGRVINKIMIAHSVTNQKLFGVLSTNALSETDDEASYNRFQKTYGNKRRQSIAESLNFVLKKLNGIKGTLSFEVPTLDVDKQVDADTAIAESLNGMSPLVANKVLDSMTTNEIRRLAKLPPIEGGDEIQRSNPATIAMRTMETQDPVIVAFERCGSPKAGKKFIASRDNFAMDIDDGQAFKDATFKHRFAALSDIQLNVLKLIGEGKTAKEIKDELNLESGDLAKARRALTKGGYIDGSEITSKGQIEIVNIEEVEVVYSYETRPNAPALIGHSRAFCERMLELDRVYTRADIDSISSAVDRNVWQYRGGWYHDPETGKNQPSCRHYWLQHLTIR